MLATPLDNALNEKDYGKLLKAKLNESISHEQMKCSHSASVITNFSNGSSKLRVAASVNLCLPLEESDPVIPRAVTNEHVTIHILRYANSTPLLENGDDAMSCLLTRAVRSLDWANYGYRMRQVLDDTECAHTVGGEMLTAPIWELEYTRGEHFSLAMIGRKRALNNVEGDLGPLDTANESSSSLTKAMLVITVDITGHDGPLSRFYFNYAYIFPSRC